MNVESKGRIILSKDERAALTAIHDAPVLGQQTPKELRFSVRLVELGLVGRNAEGRLAITTWGKEILARRLEQTDGAYTRKRGLRRTYEYSVIWGEGEQSAWWSALVRYDGEVKGTPGGNIVGPLTADEATAVELVESSIEDLVAVRE